MIVLKEEGGSTGSTPGPRVGVSLIYGARRKKALGVRPFNRSWKRYRRHQIRVKVEEKEGKYPADRRLKIGKREGRLERVREKWSERKRSREPASCTWRSLL